MQKFFKSKLGFTLVELLVVVVILSIILAVGIPVYRNVSKNARIKTCNVNQREIAKQAKEWCIDNKFNSDYNYKIITSDGEKGSITNHKMSLSNDDLKFLEEAVHHNNVLCCPAGGEIVLTVIPEDNGIPKIEVTCTGGEDGDCHKETKQ